MEPGGWHTDRMVTEPLTTTVPDVQGVSLRSTPPPATPDVGQGLPVTAFQTSTGMAALPAVSTPDLSAFGSAIA